MARKPGERMLVRGVRLLEGGSELGGGVCVLSAGEKRREGLVLGADGLETVRDAGEADGLGEIAGRFVRGVVVCVDLTDGTDGGEVAEVAACGVLGVLGT